MSVNEATFLGRACAQAELKESQQGTKVLTFTLAVHQKRADAFESDYIPCVVFGPSAERHAPYIQKDTLVRVFGKLKTSEWRDKNNQTIKSFSIVCYRTEIIMPQVNQGYVSSEQGQAL